MSKSQSTIKPPAKPKHPLLRTVSEQMRLERHGGGEASPDYNPMEMELTAEQVRALSTEKLVRTSSRSSLKAELSDDSAKNHAPTEEKNRSQSTEEAAVAKKLEESKQQKVKEKEEKTAAGAEVGEKEKTADKKEKKHKAKKEKKEASDSSKKDKRDKSREKKPIKHNNDLLSTNSDQSLVRILSDPDKKLKNSATSEAVREGSPARSLHHDKPRDLRNPRGERAIKPTKERSSGIN